jgi:hypothetical protein
VTLQQIYDTSRDQPFRQRCEGAILKAAEDIVGEDYATLLFSKEKADKRNAVGVAVLNGNVRTLDSLIKAVAADIGEVADPATLTDGQIDTSVASVWDDVAGVMFGE